MAASVVYFCRGELAYAGASSLLSTHSPLVSIAVKSESWMAVACSSSEAVTGGVRRTGTDVTNAGSRQDQARHTTYHLRRANDGRDEDGGKE